MKASQKQFITKAVAVFIALAAVYAILTIIAGNVGATYAQIVMVGLGSAIFGSGLTFFLIYMTGLESKR